MSTGTVAALAVFAIAPGATPDERAPAVSDVTVAAAPGATAAARVATITPNGDGVRERALVRFRLDERATVKIVAAAVGYRARKVFDRTLVLPAGAHAVSWSPRPTIQPRTYVVRITARDARGNVGRYGFGDRPLAVVRVLGIEAAFARESYRPGTPAELLVESGDRALVLQLFRTGSEHDPVPTDNDRMTGVAVSEPVTLVRPRVRGRTRVRVWIGEWPSGVYFARLSAPDGRAGYAPVVVRPRRLGETRVAIVLPTFTWQAYNFRDADADGYGDTWYTGRSTRVALTRPFLDRGVPPFFRVYDLNFLRWLDRRTRIEGRPVADYLADGDLHVASSAAALARAYDLIVFPGHHEYVTARQYALVRGFRDRGGNLMFLSANNFFWRVDRRGNVLTRVALWRELGRPEAALVGVQYFASDRGRRRGAFVVRAGGHWVFAETGLSSGSRFGSFGIEIDRTTRHSPRGTSVLAELPGVFGPRKTAQMTYYETRKTARVFAAGAFTLAGWAMYAPVTRVLDNLWERLSRP